MIDSIVVAIEAGVVGFVGIVVGFAADVAIGRSAVNPVGSVRSASAGDLATAAGVPVSVWQ
jgi:hypothetical protein